MALKLPPNFQHDIEGRSTSLIPVVVIGNATSTGYGNNPVIRISTTQYTDIFDTYKPLLLNISAIRESIDLRKSSYKISSVTLSISNHIQDEEQRFSDIVGGKSLINMECRILWVSPSTDRVTIPDLGGTQTETDSYALLVYNGIIRKYDHSADIVKLTLEDYSQFKMQVDLPRVNLGADYDVPPKYKNAAVPMVYGNIDKSPCVIKSISGDDHIIIDDKPLIEVITEEPVNIPSFTGSADYNQDRSWARDMFQVWNGEAFLPVTESALLKYHPEGTGGTDEGTAGTPENPFTSWESNWVKQCEIDLENNNKIKLFKVFDVYDADIDAEETENTPFRDNFLEAQVLRKVSAIRNSINHVATTVYYGGDMIQLDADGTPYGIDDINGNGNVWGVKGSYAEDLNPYIHTLTDNDPSTGFFLTDTDENIASFFATPEARSRCELYSLSPQSNAHRGVKTISFEFEKLGDEMCQTRIIRSIYVLQQKNSTDTASSEQHLSARIFFKDYFGSQISTETLIENADKTFQNYYIPPSAGEPAFSILGKNMTTVGTWDEAQIIHWNKLDTFSNYKIILDQDIDKDSPQNNWHSYLFGWVNGLAVYHRILIDKAYEKEFFVNVNGRDIATWHMEKYGVEFPVSRDQNTFVPIIKHIVVEELNNSPDDPLSDINPSIEDGHLLHYDFTIAKATSPKKILTDFSAVSQFLPRFDSLGNFRNIHIKREYTGDDLLDSNSNQIPNTTIAGEDVIDFTFSKSPDPEQIVTKVILKYNWDYARKSFTKSAEATISELLGFYKYDHYGFNNDEAELEKESEYISESTLVIDDDRGKYIRNDATAKIMAEWLVLQNCNQHLRIQKLRLPLKYMNLEVGDIVEFDSLLGGIAPYGIYYQTGTPVTSRIVNGQEAFPYFIIDSKVSNLEYVEFSCTMTHRLQSHGEDCLGLFGGPALIDECGTCMDQFSTDFNMSCADCAGVPNGNAEEDCNGDCDGGLTVDECGVCGGDDTSCIDCNGVPNGGASLDNCDVCNEDPADDCTQDCFGEWGGSAIDCGCGCGNPCVDTDNDGILDCIDDCVGELGCDGICNSGAKVDECGVCGGGAFNFDGEFYENGWCNCSGDDYYDCCVICGGDNTLCTDCNGEACGWAVFDNCGHCTGEGTYHDSIFGGADLCRDACGKCPPWGGQTGDEGYNDDIHLEFLGDSSIGMQCDCDVDDFGNYLVWDCNEVCGGNSIPDDCGVCNGDNSSCVDCAGIPNGTHWESECGCVPELNSGDDCDDCAGEPNGLAEVDECGVCEGPGIGEGNYIECWDGNFACDIYGCPDIPSSPELMQMLLGFGGVAANISDVDIGPWSSAGEWLYLLNTSGSYVPSYISGSYGMEVNITQQDLDTPDWYWYPGYLAFDALKIQFKIDHSDFRLTEATMVPTLLTETIEPNVCEPYGYNCVETGIFENTLDSGDIIESGGTQIVNFLIGDSFGIEFREKTYDLSFIMKFQFTWKDTQGVNHPSGNGVNQEACCTTLNEEQCASCPDCQWIDGGCLPVNPGVPGCGQCAEPKALYVKFNYSANGKAGDMDGDGRHNIKDLVALANCIEENNCANITGNPGDLTGDGEYNILDILTLANCILEDRCEE